MKLVEFLVAGVEGAANGTATFVLRGTASSAAAVLYSDFEGTTQPGTNVITLDSNGTAEVYVNAYCDVTIKNSGGSTLRTVTVGDAASCVEVISDSFTGTDYSGSPTAVSEPITLAAILDKWNNSAGSPDWKVTVNGVATNLSSAIAGFFGMFTNVKDPAYGATGDGVTDDTSAINAAITAAAGGIVFFPAGTYRVSSLTVSTVNVNFLGSGPNATIISGNTATSNICNFNDNTSAGWKRIEGIKFTSSATYTSFISIEQSQNVLIKDCDFDATNVSSFAIARVDVDGDGTVFIQNCKFTVGSGVDACIANLSDLNECAFVVSGCRFIIAASFTGDVIQGSNFTVSNCEFDASAVTSGTYYHIDVQDPDTGVLNGTITNCTFLDGGSSGFVFDLRTIVGGSTFYESGNIFRGFTAPSAVTSVGNIYDLSFDSASQTNTQIYLGGRLGRFLTFTDATASLTLEAGLVAENIHIISAAAGAVTLTPPELPPGCELNVYLKANHGAVQAIDIVSTDSEWEISNTDSVGGDTIWGGLDGNIFYGKFKAIVDINGAQITIPIFSSIPDAP